MSNPCACYKQISLRIAANYFLRAQSVKSPHTKHSFY